MKHPIPFCLWLLLGTFAFIYWWENALISIPLSEAVWTFYLDLTGHSNPGLASDLEFLTAIGIGFLLSYAGVRLPLRFKKICVPRTISSPQKQRGQVLHRHICWTEWTAP
jgi:hypothetical protein